jgi:hypothetical protein
VSSPERLLAPSDVLAATTPAPSSEASTASTATAEAAAWAHASGWPERSRAGELRRWAGELPARHLPLIADVTRLDIAHDIRRQWLAGRRTLTCRLALL